MHCLVVAVFFIAGVTLVFGDQKCMNMQGKCQIDSISCPGGYKSRLCSGSARRRCCLPSSSGDRKCTNLKGKCQHDGISCPGGYRSGKCSGSARRRCCLPSSSGDRKCTNLKGKCQHDGISCPGGYRSGKCSGSARRRCCLPAGDRKCNSRQGKCQSDSKTCHGRYRSNLCSGASNRRCCLPKVTSGSGRVDYRGFTVSDQIVRNKLQAIANSMNTRVWVTSGDRRSGRKTSHHYVGRAADFWVDGGYSGGQIFNHIRSSGLLATDFQVIWHGSNTCTGGQHIHIGRYGDGRKTCWVHEGTTSGNRCKYPCM